MHAAKGVQCKPASWSFKQENSPRGWRGGGEAPGARGFGGIHTKKSAHQMRSARNECKIAGMRFSWRLLSLLCLSLTLAAQTPPQESPPATTAPAPEGEQRIPTFRGGVTEVMAPVTVTNEYDEFVVTLRPEDFRLYDNNIPQQIKVELTELPLSVVILLGVSSRVEPLLPQVKKTAPLFTNMLLGESDEAAILIFDHRVEVVQNFTRDPERVGKVFKDLNPGSSTQSRLTDSMVRALSMLGTRPRGRRKVILAIAESRDMGSENNLGYVMQEAQLANVSIYTVGLSTARAQLTRKPPPPPPSPFPPGATGTRPGIPPAPSIELAIGPSMDLGALLVEAFHGVKNVFFDHPLEAYAKSTGAVYLDGFSSRAVERAVLNISQELRSQYLVTYRPNNLNQGGFHTIKVIVDRPGVKVRTRPGYFFPGGTSPQARFGKASPQS